MKKILYTFLTISLLLGSCVRVYDEPVDPTANQTLGILNISLQNNAGEDSEKIHTVRMIIFNQASSTPVLDFNELEVMSDNEATHLTINAKTAIDDDKIVFIVANEPDALTTTLASVDELSDLEAIQYSFAQFLNANPVTLKTTGMPMTGVLRGVEVTQRNVTYPAVHSMVIERAVARVDFYLRPKTEGTVTGYIKDVTSVTLDNSYDTGSLVMGNVENGTRDNAATEKNFGKPVPTIDAATLGLVEDNWKKWSATTTESITFSGTEDNLLYVCTFYTAERKITEENQRLALSLQGIKAGAGVLIPNTYPLTTMTKEGESTPVPFNEIRRNSIYKVIGNVTANTSDVNFELSVVHLTRSPQSVILDDDYYLYVSEDELYFPAEGYTRTIYADTDYYPKQELTLGYPQGLIIEIPSEVSDWIKMDFESGNSSSNTDGIYGFYEWGAIELTLLDNKTEAERRAKIYVRAGNMTKVINVIQAPAIPEEFTDAPVSEQTYVGAFWRADQTGERLIRIPVTHETAGDWSVQVFDYGYFDSDDIVFSTDMTTDPNVGWRYGANELSVADMNTSTNDARYCVMGNNTCITGTAQAGGYIFFRVGLKTRWTWENDDYYGDSPARYAVLVLSYKGNTQRQKIWLRQGHEADYLMRRDDIDRPSSVSRASVYPNNREYAMRFMPYNLTHPKYKYGTSGTATFLPADIRSIPVEDYFTSYPTQAGAYYQWASDEIYAYHPSQPSSGGITGWRTSDLSGSYWSDFYINNIDTKETCPQGYTRPYDGNWENSVESCYFSESQIAQSLFYEDPGDLTVSYTENSVWGYYADGFFDRRKIEYQPCNEIGAAMTAVAVNTLGVAYIGRLYYNPNNFASLFFPAAGNRSNDGSLENTGRQAYFWSTTSKGNEGWSLQIGQQESNLQSVSRISGASIRCVKERPQDPA